MNDQNHICPDALSFRFNAIYCINRPFILTSGNLLITGMPYLYTEGSYIAGVRIESISVVDDWLYLELQELGSDRMFNASWNLDYEGSFYVWTIGDIPSLISQFIV